MTRTALSLIAAAALLAILPACGSASMIRRDTRGGRIELHGAYMESVRDARAMMRTHCHGGYAVEGGPRSHEAAPDRDQSAFDFVCESGDVTASR